MSNISNNSLLLIEDDAPIANALKNYLEKAEFDLLLATDGFEGLKMALKHHPVLILLDIIMPKMDGLTMLKKLREDKWGKTVPVILLSNLSNPETEKDAEKYMVKDYIIKSDLSMSGVLKKIKALL